jgi:hypothetical protein
MANKGKGKADLPILLLRDKDNMGLIMSDPLDRSN